MTPKSLGPELVHLIIISTGWRPIGHGTASTAESGTLLESQSHGAKIQTPESELKGNPRQLVILLLHEVTEMNHI